MDSTLPATGTAELLELLSPFVPDDFINQTWPQTPTGGRRRRHSTAQLFRVHLLSLLTPVHSLNLLVRLPPEQIGWRRFARLRNRYHGPDVRILHEFRARVGVAGFRAINAHLLEPMVEHYAWRERSVGLIDATALPTACGGFYFTPAQQETLFGLLLLASRSARNGSAAASNRARAGFKCT